MKGGYPRSSFQQEDVSLDYIKCQYHLMLCWCLGYLGNIDPFQIQVASLEHQGTRGWTYGKSKGRDADMHMVHLPVMLSEEMKSAIS